MPKLIDHDERRDELAAVIWQVIRTEGIEGASVRRLAERAGISPGSLRHYFPSQAKLLAFAIRLVATRIEKRIARLESAEDGPRARVKRLLEQLLPLDAERRAENDVWLAFGARALVDPSLGRLRGEIDDELRGACRRALGLLADSGDLHPARDSELELDRLHALLDGLALHGATRPRTTTPRRMRAALTIHLDGLALAPPRDTGGGQAGP